jgi:hypothetical protein
LGWLHSLLGEDWTFNVKVRQKKGGPGKLVYRGARAKPLDEYRAAPTADLPGYEFRDPVTDFKRYRLRDQVGAYAEASAPLPPLKKETP